MKRNIKTDVIVLKKIPVGESNSGITLLSRDVGLVFAMAFGAQKAKNSLFGVSNPLVYGHCDLYHDPVKDLYRIKEMSAHDFFEELAGDLECFYTATLFCEIVIKSFGGAGESEELFDLLLKTLNALKHYPEKREYILIQFLLRYLALMGFLPDLNSCCGCGRERKSTLYYNGQDELLCSGCILDFQKRELSAGACVYGVNTLNTEFEMALRISLEKNSLESLKGILIDIVKNHTEGNLLTLKSASGLI